MRKLIKWHKDEKGQGMVEYSLIIGLIAAIVIVALVALGPKISAAYDNIADKLLITEQEHTNNGNHGEGNNGNGNGNT